MSSTGQRYRFGPLERRGLIGSLRAPQVVAIALGLTGAVVLMRTLSGGAGIVSALALALAAVGVLLLAHRRSIGRGVAAGRHPPRRPPSSRPAQIRIGRASSRSAPGKRRPARAHRRAAGPGPPPRTARRSVPGRTGRRDQGPQDTHVHGRRSRSESRRSGFSIEPNRKAGKPDGAASSPVSRARAPRSAGSSGSSAPCPPTATRSVATSARRGIATRRRSTRCRCSPTSSSRAPRPRSRPITSSSSASRSMRSSPGGRSNAPEASKARMPARAACCCASSRRSPSDWPPRTSRSSGALRPGTLASAFRVAFDPWSRPGLARLAAADPERDGIDEAAAWPTATENSWGIYRTEGAFHATYWISGWPRIEVGAAFLSPLLLHAQMVRAIGVTIEPISPAEGDPRGRSRPDERHRRP